MSRSRVREAFETSVTWTRPLVRRQMRNESTVPVGGDRAGPADRGDDLAGRRKLGVPERLGVVSDVAGRRIALLELTLGDGGDRSGPIEGDRPCARRAFVEGEDVATGHGTANSR